MIVVAAFLLYLAGLAELHQDVSVAAGMIPSRAPLTSERAGGAVKPDLAEPERLQMQIRWLKADLAVLDARIKGATLLNSSRSRCVLVVPEIQTDGDPVYVLGHEALHCFKGRFHGSGEKTDEIDLAREQMLTEILPALVPPEELLTVPNFRPNMASTF